MKFLNYSKDRIKLHNDFFCVATTYILPYNITDLTQWEEKVDNYSMAIT